MDYTSVQYVKDELNITGEAKDALLARLVTAASRAIDSYCAGSPEAVDYFKLETVTDEETLGIVNNHGKLIVFPRKPKATAVSSLSYRIWPDETYSEVETYRPYKSWIEGVLTGLRTCEVEVKLSYSGGLGATLAGLPTDLVEAATVMCGRFFKEAEGGLTDAVGVAELGTIMYTKAMPIRVREMLKPYKRQVPL